MNSSQKLALLREKITDAGLEGFLVPHADEYMGEYTPDCAERLAWLTDFTGSAGFAVVLNDACVVMSDGRYTIQLESQVDLDSFTVANSQEVKMEDWVLENANADLAIGYDPKLHTASEVKKLSEAGIKLLAVEQNLIDEIWENRPSAPTSEISLFSQGVAGVSASEKISLIADKIKQEGAQAFVLTLSDSVAWLLNIRANDVPHIPVALSYAIIHDDERVQWFVDADRLTNEAVESLKKFVDFLPVDALPNQLEYLGKSGSRVGVDSKRSSIWIQNVLEGFGAQIIDMQDPCILPRACKTESEQSAMRQAHIRDGVAMVKFLKWFEEEAPSEKLTELSVEAQLEKFRAEAPEFKEPSFSTIAGYGANGAIVHYRADVGSSATIKSGSLLLLDSGAQYEDGTTDITRTMPIGAVSDEMKRCFTLVLKGHINLAQAEFEDGTIGKELDVLARAPLQAEGFDYAHGTGHGVGCYLSVHEEAAGISPRGLEPPKEGMVISNEPGYYKTGEFGIRIESLVMTQKNDAGKLYFDTITLAPISKELVVVDMLTEDERKWLDQYHANVLATLSPLLDASEKLWLEQACAPL